MKRKFLASIVAAVCALSVSPFSMSAAAEFTGNDTVTLTISNAKAGDEFACYKVVDITYHSTANYLSYDWNAEFSAYFGDTDNSNWSASLSDAQKTAIDSDGKITVEEFSAMSQDNLQLVLANLANYASGKSTITTDAVVADEYGTANFGDQTMGGYFIVPTSTTEVYAPIFKKIEPTINSDTKEYELIAYTQEVQAKHSSVSIAKTVKNTNKTGSAFEDETTATVGDTLEYQIIADVPKYDDSALNKSFTISDILPEGLDFVDNTVTVKAVNANTDVEVAAGTNYTLAVGDDTATTDKTECFTVSVNKAQYDAVISESNTWCNMSQIKITFKAKLNTSAAIGATNEGVTVKNTNTAELKFSYPYINNTVSETASDTADVVTYGLQVVKYTMKDSNTVYLAGAEFGLYTDAECTTQIGSAVTTDAYGKGYFDRLAPGTYYLKEIKAPAGYNAISEIKTVIITTGDEKGDNYYKVAAADDNATLAKNGYATIQVQNNAGFTLPSTGGAGTVLFCVLGIIFMLTAVALIAVFFVTILRKKSNANK